MDNITTMDLFPTKDVTEIGRQVTDTSTTHPHLWDSSDASAPPVYNSTSTPADTVELSAAALAVYLAVRILWGILAIFGMSQLN